MIGSSSPSTTATSRRSFANVPSQAAITVAASLYFGIDHSAIGLILRGLDRVLHERDEQAAWRDITEAVTRAGPG
jgi:hypothetical protein